MSIEKPFALVRPYYGFQCDIIEIKAETAKTVTAIERSAHSSRWSEHERRSTKDKILARYATEEEAVAAMKAGVVAAREHDAAVKAAWEAHTAAEVAQRDAWLAALTAPTVAN